ncbi:MAG: SCO family protein [Deltaproteobacteria bacterium]|nr:SCO family protein [Deltaproteobacteria bacterium]
MNKLRRSLTLGLLCLHPAVTVFAEDEMNLYDYRAKLVDQDGGAIDLNVYAGRPVIFSFFYASCSSACPRLISDVKGVLSKMDEAERREVRVLLISIDPEVDSEAKLQATVERHQLDRSQWKLARTSKETLRELAAIVDLKYRKESDGNIQHSSVLTLIDSTGRITGRFEGLGRELEPIVARLTAMVRTRRNAAAKQPIVAQ